MKDLLGCCARLALMAVAVASLSFGAGSAEAQEIGFRVTGMGVGAHQPDAAQSPVAVKSGSGFSIGGFLIAPVSEHLALQVEAAFSRRNIDLTNNPAVPSLANDTLLLVPIDSRFRADYVEVPLLLRVPARIDGTSIHG